MWVEIVRRIKLFLSKILSITDAGRVAASEVRLLGRHEEEKIWLEWETGGKRWRIEGGGEKKM